MIKRMTSMILAIVMVMSVIVVAPNEIASALTFEDFMYEVKIDGTVEITYYQNSATGAVVIPSEIDGKRVTSIANIAFNSCTKITSVTIPESVISIGESAFSSCSSLTSVTIPKSVTSIGAWVFIGCIKLTTIDVAADNANYISVDGVLYNKAKTELIQCPAGNTRTTYVISGSVTSIGGSAFDGCRSLTSVTIPGSVISIGDYAFDGCISLTSVTIPGSVTSIGDLVFQNCSSLTSVTIPNGVTRIGDRAFYSCKNLTSVIIPESVTSIGDRAFYDCSSLTSVTIPASVTSIGNMAFSNCSSLTSVTIPASVTSIGVWAFIDCIKLTTIDVAADNANYTSVDGVLLNKAKTELIQYPIGNTRATYVIPESVSMIYDWVFKNCSSLTDVTIPGSVTSIGNYAFNDCKNLTSVTIPRSVNYIGSLVFWNCIKLITIDVAADNANYASVDGVLFNKAKIELIQYPAGNTRATYVIPESVASIGERAFDGCRNLTDVTIPISVTSIIDWAFYDCSSLTSVTIPGNVTNIGNGVFSGCTKLTTIDVATDNANYTSVDGVLFNKEKTELMQYPVGNTKATYVVPSSVISIGDRSFQSCSSLTSVTIPSSVTRIGWNAFEYCSSLTSVTISGGVTNIGRNAFSSCIKLTAIDVATDNANYTSVDGVLFNKDKTELIQCPAGNARTTYVILGSVVSIGESAFGSCGSLTSVTIPWSATSIYRIAFEGCNSLTRVIIPGSVTHIDDTAFQDSPNLTIISSKSSFASIYAVINKIKFILEDIPFIPNDLNGDNIIAIDDALIALKCELGIVARNPLAGNASAKNILSIVV